MRKLLFLALLCGSCSSDTGEMFRLLSSSQTGVKFVNQVKPSPDLNIFNYMYFYNGGGVGAGDFNQDGLIDLVFTANQSDNRLYLNRTDLANDKAIKLEDITEQSGFKAPAGWSTGVSIADINQDGLLDIYISRIGEFEGLQGHNLLFICREIDSNGIPHFEEKAAEYGLDLVGFGTQAAFFDYDADGDLDFFQLNHSVHQNGTFGKRDLFLNTFHPLAGDRFFENQHGKFVETTSQVGIHSSALGYGLGLAIADLNLDGYPDMYVGNDFHENDYLYLNQRNKTFRDETDERLLHTSRFTMGVDIADLNNDLFPEILSLDMLPYDPEILKRSEGEDAFYNFRFKLSQGYNVQFARNNLQLNSRKGRFSEIGLYAGIHATDWSWSVLLFDFENDGKKDVFISNGINKRMNDMDYINFMSNDRIQQLIAEKRFDESDQSLVDLLPEVKIPNKFFSQNTELRFEELTISPNPPSYSNGAVYADLDNDGDLDIITNNINSEAFIYENRSKSAENKHLRVELTGKNGNRNAIGAKVLVYTPDGRHYQEKFSVRGFQSSAEIPLLFGLGKVQKIDSVVVIWPDNTTETIFNPNLKNPLRISQKEGLPAFNYASLHQETYRFEEITAQIGLEAKHEENKFNEFDREILLPNLLSTEGPALAVADANGDGLDDIFLGNARGFASALYLQKPNGKFEKSLQPAFEKEADFEDIDAVWADVNQDGTLDLIVGSGGNEYFGASPYLQPRLYLNDPQGVLRRDTSAFAGYVINAQVVRVADFNQDSHPDVFVGARSVPFSYGVPPTSYLFLNDGKGRFVEKTPSELANGGMVKDAKVLDLDQDNDPDLVIAYEWGKIVWYENQKESFVPHPLTDRTGWWNFLYPTDLDHDGDLDWVCGNVGLNSRLKATPTEPVRLYVNDFDDNTRTDAVLTYYVQGRETIFADKRELERQMPFIKKQFLRSKEFAKASIQEVLGKKINEARVLQADFLENAWLENKGKGVFELRSLGNQAQYSSYHAAESVGKELLLLGNYYDCNIQMGQYDADWGSIFQNNGKNEWLPKPLLPTRLTGQVRRIANIKIGHQNAYLIARNNEKLMVLKTSKP